jgi:ATP-dependent Lon protease
LDHLDKLAASVFDGYLVRKDLVQKYSRQYPVPTYVVEFLLGRYCASVDADEIAEGLQIVEKQLKDRTVRTGEEELFKARARETGSVKIIDMVKARLDAKNDCYVAELPSLVLRDVRIDDEMVRENERMLTDGFYAEVTLSYDGIIAQEKGGRPFKVDALRPIQMSKSDVLDIYIKGRRAFTTAEWADFLLRSIGLEPSAFSERAKRVALLRMVPFVERNYNLVELGPRGTGKSHLFQQISPYAHLISGGKATVAKMFVNNATGQRGLVCQYDVVCFDEVSGISFDQKDGVNIMKGYMASGQFSRAKENIRAEGSIVMVGNLDVDVEQQQKIGHLLSPMPPEMRDDTAFMDRIHAYAPGWDYPKLKPSEHLTDHFGLVSDFLSECWSRLRSGNRISFMQGRVHLGGALSGRDIEAVNKTVSGLTKLLFPDPEMPISDEDLEWMVRVALESRRRVKEQQRRVFKSEFRNTHFSYILGPEGVEQFVATPELHSDEAIESDPLPPGQVWGVSLGTSETGPGLYRIEVTCGPGSGVRILNQPTPPAFRESVRVGEQNL